MEGEILAEGEFELELVIFSDDLVDGVYYATMVIGSDDPTNPEVLVEFFITIIGGTPQISVDNTTLNFGSKSIGGTYVLPVEVSNLGTSPLEISEISTSKEFYSIQETELTILPGDAYTINVSFMPIAEVEYPAILSLVNNVEGESPLEIALSGTGIGVAGISSTPESFTEELVSGTTVTRTLTINSTGDIPLEWVLKTRAADSEPVLFEKDNYADWTLTGNIDVISPNVAITRQDNAGIFNIVEESSYIGNVAPTNTLWAFGFSGQIDPSNYDFWRLAVDYDPPSMVNQQMSMYLVEEDQYIDIKFLSWTESAMGGGFSYIRDASVQFIDFGERSGTTNPTESVDVDVVFDATYLPAGEYYGFIVIHTNIPSTPIIDIPVSLTVTGEPEINVSETDIDFGTIILGKEESLEFSLTNTGTDELLITAIASDNTLFTVGDFVEALQPGEFENIMLTFIPDAIDNFTGTLTINSNDAINPLVTINLLGEGIGSPVVLVDKEFVTETIEAGTTLDIEVSVDNDGPTNLQGMFLAKISGKVDFEKVDYADFNIEENQDRITDNVWITRANSRGIFNIKHEAFYDRDDYTSPAKTLWVWGSGLEADPADYDYWGEAVNYDPPDMVDEVINMMSVDENRYFDFIFLSWTENAEGGGFSYSRYEIPSWIKMTDREFDVATGVPTIKTFTIDATNLYAGEYQANVIIQSNDAETPELIIPINLTVTGDPEINVATPLVFDDTSVGLSSTKTLTIGNTGLDVLVITSITNTSDIYSFTPIEGDITINPGEHFNLDVEFTPLLDQLYEDVVTISSDDPINPTTLVALQGLGKAAPIISISTQQITQMLKPDVEETISIVIENNGLADLNWTIEGEKVVFNKPNLADWTLPENQDRISDMVWITRKSTQGLFNIAQENGYGTGSPIGTQWAFGFTEFLTPGDYEDWIDAVNNNPTSMIGQNISLQLVEESRYFDVLFASYAGGGTAGGFSYTRQENLPDWIYFNEVSGTVLPGDSYVVEVTINTAGLFGSYTTNFAVSSDDTFNPHIPVNVDLQVGGLEPGTPIEDIRINEGFTTTYVDLTDAFVNFDPVPLNYTVVSADKSVVTVTVGTDVETNTSSITVTEVGIGSSIITVRAEDSGGEVLFSDFLFTVNSVPTVDNPIDDVLVNEGFASQVIDLSNVFGDLDNDILEYSIESSDEAVVTVSNAGTSLTISEVGVGSATITVTADDGLANETDEFIFRVNSVPTVANPLADVLVQAGYITMGIDLSEVFADLDEDDLTYTVTNSDESIVTASLDGTTLTIDELATGTSTITVTANDGFGGEVSNQFDFRVNGPPTIPNPLADVVEQSGFGTVDIIFSDVFSDSDDDVLSYSAISSNEMIITVTVTGSTLTITEVAIGSAFITLTANDGFGGEVSDDFNFRVNASPTVSNPLTDVELDHGFGTEDIDLSGVFSDADEDDVLTYSASSSDESVVTVSVTGSTLTVTDVAVGESDITVTADDGYGGEVSTQFIFTVDYPSGIGEDFTYSMKLYPNPSSGLVNLELGSQYNGQITFEVYSIVGQLVYQKSLTISEIKTHIDLSSLSPGIYQVRVTDKSGVIGNKAIVINK
jgi:uncharacterized protein YjdB